MRGYSLRAIALGFGVSCLSAGLSSLSAALAQAALPLSLPLFSPNPESTLPVSLTVASRTMLKEIPALEGPVWGLTHYVNAAGERVAAQVYGTQSPSIQFTEGSIAGNGTCNRFFGTYQVTDLQLAIRPGGSTLMACPPAYMDQEQAFLAALAKVSRYGIEAGELQVFDANGDLLLTFSELVPPTLTGHLWELTAFNNGRGAVTSVVTDTRITASFDGEGRLTGSAGCNTYNAAYSITGAGITIHAPATTHKFCAQPEGIMDQETAYLAALTTAATYQLEENRLTLKTSSGATVAQFSLATEAN